LIILIIEPIQKIIFVGRPFMMKKYWIVRSRTARLVLLAVLAFQLVACGTILYPERQGQKSGRIDPGVAILDGLGLLLFIVPGVIAFGVDFATGAIYLPPGEGSSSREVRGMTVVRIRKGPLTREKIARTVQEQTGVTVNFSSPELRVYALEDGDVTSLGAALSTGASDSRTLVRGKRITLAHRVWKSN
jgi:hypothetical protein